MAAMSIYVDDQGRTVLHRAGWSWLAALALPVWALYRKQWLVLLAATVVLPLLYVAANAAIEAVPGAAAQQLLALGWLAGWWVICGALANRWHRWSLLRAGYRLIATDEPP